MCRYISYPDKPTHPVIDLDLEDFAEGTFEGEKLVLGLNIVLLGFSVYPEDLTFWWNVTGRSPKLELLLDADNDAVKK